MCGFTGWVKDFGESEIKMKRPRVQGEGCGRGRLPGDAFVKVERSLLGVLALAVGVLLTACSATAPNSQWAPAVTPTPHGSAGLTFKDVGVAGDSYIETVKNFPSWLPLPAGQSFPMALPASWNPKVIVDKTWGSRSHIFTGVALGPMTSLRLTRRTTLRNRMLPWFNSRSGRRPPIFTTMSSRIPITAGGKG